MTEKHAVLTVLGAAQTVTGSKLLLEMDGHSVLIDCGLFQGLKELRERNWDRLPIDVSRLDSILITHAHLDHCGYLPRLAQAGCSSPVHVTYDTGRLMSVVLPDSGRLLEEEAAFANKIGYSRHRPALPLYTEEDAWKALDLLRQTPFDAPITAAAGIEATFRPAGHILGSSSIHLHLNGTSVVISGDLGRASHPLLEPPSPLGGADWIVIESTYGDRTHDSSSSVDALASVIDRTVSRGGIVIIPAFAVDRTEVLLYHLHQLAQAGRLPDVPIYVDSPMALSALIIYRDALRDGADDLRPTVAHGGDPFALPNLHEVHDADGSKRVTRSNRPAIIIAGSGMATGGRVIHHLARHLPDPRNTVVLAGFQAAGTRGRSLLDGAESIKIHGQYIPVRAEIADLTGFSVHADRTELLEWLATATKQPEAVFIVHGEDSASRALQRAIQSELGWNAVVPRLGERLSLVPMRHG